MDRTIGGVSAVIDRYVNFTDTFIGSSESRSDAICQCIGSRKKEAFKKLTNS